MNQVIKGTIAIIKINGVQIGTIKNPMIKTSSIKDNPNGLDFYTDGKRHLVCKPYSVENLHRMAEKFNIKRCHFELSKNGRLAHYDIPKKRQAEIEAKCIKVNYREIVNIIKGI